MQATSSFIANTRSANDLNNNVVIFNVGKDNKR